MRTIFLSAAVALALLGSGCSAILPQSCPTGLKALTEAELFFGRDIQGGGSVSDADWQNFLDAEVTPRFSDGFTVEDASGQWRDQHGLVREKSKRLTIVLTGAPDEQAKLLAIRDLYKQRFRQDAVLLLESSACGSF
jgi:hypothetical protein